MCRGTGGSSADVAVGPGLAAAGQVEIECVLQTNDVVGECVGMQLDPKYANGDYELGAFLTTDAGDRRDVVASQPIALDNSGFVRSVHVPGSEFQIGSHTKGLTFYGGPSVEGNVNTFHACPVAYDGTTAASVAIQAKVTGPEAAPLTSPPPALALFRSNNVNRYGVALADDEAPFTWEINSSINGAVENTAGVNEHWMLSGTIIDPNGLDVTSRFPGQGMRGPLYFDFKAPARTNDSEVVIGRSNSAESTTARYYSDGPSSSNRFWITEMSDMGVGHVYGTTSAIAVGDCSVRGNADTSGGTAFTPLEGLDNVTHVSQLAEEDPAADPVNDGGGIDCYVAEVQALADRLDNAVNLSRVARIRTNSTFGVDRTPPVISRERPSEALVLNPDGANLFFEVEDPRFESGEDGSGMDPDILVLAGSSNPRSNAVYWRSTATVASDGSVMIDINSNMTARFGREQQHTVYAWAGDRAENYSLASFTFTRDGTEPSFALTAAPTDFGLTQAASVSVTVAGTLTDATEIRRAFLSVHHGTACTADTDPLAATQAASPVRRLHNGTNKIEFSEVFTIKKAGDIGATDYCFFLNAEDDARNANGGAAENAYEEVVGTFSVTWPGTKPVGPVATTTPIDDMSIVAGGTGTQDVSGHFSNAKGAALTYTAASSDAAVATVSMSGAVATVTAVAAGTATITVTASDGGTGTADKSWDVTVTAAPPPTVYGLVFTDASDMPLTMVEVDEGSGEDGGTTYKVALDQMPSDDVTVAIGVAEANRAGIYAILSTDELTFTSANYSTAQEVTVTTLDHDANAVEEMFTLTHDPSGAEYASAATANVSGMVNDDEVALMASLMSVGENDDTTAVTVSVSTDVADAGDGSGGGDKTVTVTLGGSGTGEAINGTDFDVLDADKAVISGTFQIVLPEGEARKDTMIYIVPTDDDAEENDEVIPVTGAMSGGTSLTAPVESNLVADDEIDLMDNDPDVMITTNVTSVAEDADPTAITVTVTAPDRRSVDRTFTVSVATDPSARAAAVADFTITISPGDLSNTGTFSLAPVDNTDDDGNATVTISAAVVPTAKANGVNYTIGTAEVEIVDDDN